MHLHIVMRVSHGLEIARIGARNPTTMNGFYSNFLQQYTKFSYSPSHIWNVNESGYNVSKSGLGKVLARKELKSVYAQLPNDKEWLSVLTSINAT